MITLTDSAVQQLHALMEEEADKTGGLRIFVERGGCAGMQYGMNVDTLKEGDTVTERDGARVLVDAESAPFLRGSTLDYADDLAGSGFRLQNPNAVRSCGCGTSFESGAPAAPETQSASH